MGQEESVRDKLFDSGSDPGFYRRSDSTGKSRLIWEKPLGVIRGYLDEPGPRFVDVEGEADKAACVWERGHRA